MARWAVVLALVCLGFVAALVAGCAGSGGPQESCVGNLHRLGNAVRMYAQDYAGWLPRATYHDALRNSWADAMFGRYVKDQRTYDCPAADRHMDRIWSSSPGSRSRFIQAADGFPGVGYSYAINALEPNTSLSPPIQIGGPAGRRLGAVEDPSGTILLCDAGYNEHNQTDYVISPGYYRLGDYRLEVLYYEIDAERHGVPGQFNVLYCDGRAAPRDYRDTIDPANSINEWTCSRLN